MTIPGQTMSAREFRARYRNKLTFAKNDGFSSPNELPPLTCRADDDQKHQEEKESGYHRVELPNGSLPHQLARSRWIDNPRSFARQRLRAAQETKLWIGRKNLEITGRERDRAHEAKRRERDKQVSRLLHFDQDGRAQTKRDHG